ncbi:MAG TPA: neutral zinc metallopeptidase [Arachnia sp.]|nr:neutral zinc metallopeptidase [Arachnia sp.]
MPSLIGFGVLSLMGSLLDRLQEVVQEPPRVPSVTTPSVGPPDDPDQPQPPVSEPQAWQLPDRSWPAIPPANSSDPNWTVVQTSALYSVPFPAHLGCPSPGYAYDYREMETYVTQQMACIQNAWHEVQAQLGYSTADIPVYFFRGEGVSSACGYVEAPAFYCSADGGTIYFGQGTLDWATFQPFGMKDMATHEFGHHLQAQAGFFEAMYYLGSDNEIIRRSELQATCFGHGMIGRDDSFVMDEAYYRSLVDKHRQVLVDGTHGSNESNDFWGFRGLYATSLSECNTWTSPSADVE